MVAAADTVIVAELELAAAQTWASRHGVSLQWLPEDLEVRATFTQPVTGDPYYLRGTLADYRELPPIWVFTNDEWTGDGGRDLAPEGVHTPFGSSIFIVHEDRPVICAHFNRLAYGSGPHKDWGDAALWLTAGAGHVRAGTLGDMLHVIHRDFLYTTRRLSP